MARVLVVDDDHTVREVVVSYLRANRHEVVEAEDGESALSQMRSHPADLVVLDLMLPGIDGLEVCKRIQRDRRIPVLMLTARDSEADLEVGLAVGGDDYMTKPFSPRELVARVKALLRRTEHVSGRDAEPIRLGTLVIDPAARTVTLDGRDVHLTATEFDLLHRLAQTPHVVYARRRLLSEVWGYREGAGERTVDSHVRAIRRKLSPGVIRTVHGIGYALDTNGLL